MPEPTGTPAGNPPVAPPPAGDPLVATSETTAATLEQANAELAAARAALKAANNESAQRRKKLEEYEAAENKRKEAELTETQRLQKQLADAQAESARVLTQANERIIQSAFMAEAAKQGATHPGDAYALADRSAVTIDAAGNVTGVDKAVEAVVKAGRLPVKAATQPPDINASNQGGAGKLTPEQLREKKLKSGMYSKM
jgi:hypothetical protein